MEVTERDDPRIEAYADLTDMDLRQRVEPARGIFMAEGHLVIERCARHGLDFVSVLTSPRWLPRLAPVLAGVDVDVLVADESVLQAITGFRVHRGALAAVRRPRQMTTAELISGGRDLLVLEELVDPTNVGLAIRSAVVQGVCDVVLSPGCADPLYRRAVKASMGAVLRCRWARSEQWPATLAELAAQRHVIALTPEGDVDIDTACSSASYQPVAILLGSEGPGVSPLALTSSSRTARIPMSDPDDSLNVAAAAAVACYARAQTRATP